MAAVIDASPAAQAAAQRSGRQQWTEPLSVSPLWKHQASLPTLPVPDLQQTCLRYLSSVRPLLTPTEFEATRAAVVDFALSGDGAKLQQRLTERRKAHPLSSWL
eukprot:CAMPEP_0173403328 /NCGR_PEP_ID=MMETSP1356-20130122/56497_1 /TAXON_ID=77927 ORGANISM="Hemiselmis virescens, Strain PCC157" /NCGR_SAMPLE_ID=MMETSP1356 /ASSEMBLY_ACC=CAM_ASM_000847 /LENGTH=103 /DNA_ID=CAMNT_0014363839 /DNA_START=77 /DNA_END=385 /DNA_ORIENTATION=+